MWHPSAATPELLAETFRGLALQPATFPAFAGPCYRRQSAGGGQGQLSARRRRELGSFALVDTRSGAENHRRQRLSHRTPADDAMETSVVSYNNDNPQQ